MQELLLVGLDHYTAPVEVRGRFAFTDTQKLEFVSGLLEQGASEAVVLSTCNRSLVCFTGPEPGPLLRRARQYYLHFFDGGDYADCVTALRGRTAIEELLRITCGLRSVVIGEDQILGQVREAQEFAQQTGSSGKILNKIFREAVTLAKQIKTELKISQIPLSVSYIGIKMLARAMGGLRDKNILLVGLGKMNQLSLKYIAAEQPQGIWICTRTRCRTERLPEAYAHTQPVDFADRYTLLPQMDAVITATSSPHTIFQAEKMPPRTKPLYILDMAVPRDTEAALSLLPETEVFTVDDLKRISQENLTRRMELAEQAEARIQERTDELIDWLSAASADPTIQSLQARCQEISRDTSAILFEKLDLTEREKKLVDKMIRAALDRLIREPVHKLRQVRDEGKQENYIQLIEELFDL